jgi:putative copper resistance protein D
MLATVYAGLRFIHFSTLMLVFGCLLFTNRLAHAHFERLLMRKFLCLQRVCLGFCAGSALLMYALQGGLMGAGWQDVWQPEIWGVLVDTQFGRVWLWQMIVSVVALGAAFLQPKHPGRLLLCGFQIALLAGVGHAATHDGIPGILQRTNHAVHLFCASAWFGGLLPLIYCMTLTRRRWQKPAVFAMMRFSRYGHLAVAGVLITGVLNVLMIQGADWTWHSAWAFALLFKSALVALMVVIAIVNRYVLVPRLSLNNSQARHSLILMTWTEVVLGAAVLATVSLFATWEPF